MLEPAESTGRKDSAGQLGCSREEFAAEFKSAYRVLWLIAVGIVRDRALAEDAVQEAAIIAFDKRGQFERGTNFTAWVGQMVRNVALNQSRREQRRRGSPLESEMATSRSNEGSTRDTLSLSASGQLPDDQGDFDDRVVRALSSVSEVARACLLLRTVEGLEYAEIARLLEIPEGTAMSHVHRARQFLRERLSGAWRVSTGPQ